MAALGSFSRPAGAAPAPPAPADSGLGSLLLLSPTRPRRLREKEELRHLNDRLAAYIQRVWTLEGAKETLRLRLADSEAGSGRQLDVLSRRYEGELAEARRALDDQALQRASLQVALEKMREEQRQLQARNSKSEKDLGLAVARVKDLSARLCSKEADLATSLSRQESLEQDLRESKSQVHSLEEMVQESTSHLHNEKLRRTDLEDQMKTLHEQVRFLKNLHENELRSKKRFYESRIREMETGRQKEFESKMLNALQELRQEHEQQIQEYKYQLERNFSAKIENAQISAAKNSDFASSAQEELTQVKGRADALTLQNTALEARIGELEAALREHQESLDQERDRSRGLLAEKNQEMLEMRQLMQSQLEEYEQLLDVKLALDLEISAYRALLEGEEERLKLPRCPSRRLETWATPSQGLRLFSQSKKRKRASTKKQAHSDRSLSGWIVRRQHRSESDVMFQFPARFTLLSGQLVTIWGATAGSKADPGALVWKSPKSWGVGENITITLFDADGKETAEGKITYVDRGESDGAMDTDAEEAEMQLHGQQNESRSCPIM